MLWKIQSLGAQTEKTWSPFKFDLDLSVSLLNKLDESMEDLVWEKLTLWTIYNQMPLAF